MMQFDKDYFKKYGHYRNDVGEIQRFKNFIFNCTKILWVGCSIGEGVKYLNDKNVDCIGVDINDYVISKSRIRNKVLKADILDIPFNDREFDCVICIDLLEHLTEEQIAKALSELKRVTSDRIIIRVTPKEKECFYIDPTHVTALSFDEWEKLLDAQLPERVASDFCDARYVFSKKAKKSRSFLSVDVPCKIAKVDLSSFNQADLVSFKEWLRFIENSSSFNLIPRYIIVKKHNRIVGFCPSFIFENDKLNVDEGPLLLKKYRRIVRKMKFKFGKSIIAYSPFTLDSGVLSEHNHDNVIELVCQKIDDICQESSINISTFLFLCKDEAKTQNIIKKQGYRELKLYPNTKLTSGSNSFHKYLSLVPGKAPSIHNIEDNSDPYQMKTESSKNPVPKVALVKFSWWKTRVVMNMYISLLNIFYQAKIALENKIKVTIS